MPVERDELTTESDSESQEPGGLEYCIDELRNILGPDMLHSDLVRLAVEADNDVGRAINFYFSGRIREDSCD